ncbi:PadR family transcriptional regulator [Spiractinospora alimapuensis]|uniref:PadR family transcriptional regulator n=1 Tax=Spiractinospora alimapuensis TaxID=2820884 RepID=UPI001F1EBBF6|nr:PadR family transcriptional regulator [Spiractinospora alimapuensis]QVQ51738.1 PadR family transcriptional regulator [Spiractinospora alimapuensis]
MKFLILGLLLTHSMSLYELHARFASGLGHIYSASYGSIHRALRQLHEAGDVMLVSDSVAPRNAKRYTATDQGRQAWRDWMRNPLRTEDSEASMLARVLLLGCLDSPAERETVLRALHTRALVDLQELRSIDPALSHATDHHPPHSRPGLHYSRVTLDYRLRTAQGTVTWLERLISENQPAPIVDRLPSVTIR